MLRNDLVRLRHILDAAREAVFLARGRPREDLDKERMLNLLTKEEFDNLKSQIVTSSWGGPRRATPYAFTEQGIAMLSSVLKSRRAIKVNIEIMRGFVRFRQMTASHPDLIRKLHALEKKYDAQFKVVFDAIGALMEPQVSRPKKKIGF